MSTKSEQNMLREDGDITAAAQAEKSKSERKSLEERCNDAMGFFEYRLAVVLSHFPEQAVKFISTQNYANQVDGEKGFRYSLRDEHGRIEHLDQTGKVILEAIKEIDRLRGSGLYGSSPYDFSSQINTAILFYLFNPQVKDTIEAAMIKKTMEVMEVTDEELKLLEEYSDANHEARGVMQQARELEEQAKRLKAHAYDRSEVVRKNIETVYPRAEYLENDE
ncbi:hypothetical protein KBC79_05100 [Candidatus Woesebacteria bacterium]|nr:hypothetical protein [Candidatus Woesebacteria bacterium]